MTWGRFLAGAGVVALSAAVAAGALYTTPNGLGLLLAMAAGFAGGRAARAVSRSDL